MEVKIYFNRINRGHLPHAVSTDSSLGNFAPLYFSVARFPSQSEISLPQTAHLYRSSLLPFMVSKSKMCDGSGGCSWEVMVFEQGDLETRCRRCQYPTDARLQGLEARPIGM
jgi:hypothetical protein